MKGKNKKKYIIAITSVALAACIAAVTGIFAWMTSTKSISKVSFQISQISCKVKMYKGLENDYNGVPDLLGVGLGADGKAAGSDSTYGKYKESETSSKWTNYDASDIYYKETYSFEYIANKSMLSSDGLEANTFSKITLKNVEPSRVYVYKFSVANEKNGAEGTLSYSFDGFTPSSTSTTDDNGNIIVTSLDASAFQCRMFLVKNTTNSKAAAVTDYAKYKETDTEKKTTEWFDLLEDGTNLQQNVTINAVASASDTKDSSKSNNGDIVDIWLQIRMNPEATNDFISGNADDDDTGATVTLPYFRITFKS